MTATSYYLTRLHRKLDDDIRDEMKKRLPDSFRLFTLRRLRLRTKDRLHALMRTGQLA